MELEEFAYCRRLAVEGKAAGPLSTFPARGAESELGLAREEGSPVGRVHGGARVERASGALLPPCHRTAGALTRGGISAATPLAQGRPSAATGRSLRSGRVIAEYGRWGVRRVSGEIRGARSSEGAVVLDCLGAHRAILGEKVIACG